MSSNFRNLPAPQSSHQRLRVVTVPGGGQRIASGTDARLQLCRASVPWRSCVPTGRYYFAVRRSSKERTIEQTRNLFESIHALSRRGIKNTQVVRELGIHRHAVEKHLAFKAPRFFVAALVARAKVTVASIRSQVHHPPSSHALTSSRCRSSGMVHPGSLLCPATSTPTRWCLEVCW